jgi:hypothetical protein
MATALSKAWTNVMRVISRRPVGRLSVSINGSIEVTRIA